MIGLSNSAYEGEGVSLNRPRPSSSTIKFWKFRVVSYLAGVPTSLICRGVCERVGGHEAESLTAQGRSFLVISDQREHYPVICCVSPTIQEHRIIATSRETEE